MTGFRITQILFWFGLSIYFGGLLILGTLVAPEIFNTIATAGVHASTLNPHLNEAKELAGEIFGNILYYFSIFQLLCLFLMLFSVLFQMAFHLNAMSIWVWLRLGGVLLLAVLLGAQMLKIDPAVRREHKLWLQYVNTDAAQAEVHRTEFMRDHAAAECNGIIQMILLLAIVCIQGWGINYPTRREFIRAIAQKAKLMDTPPAPPGSA